MKAVVLTSLALGAMFLLGVSSPAEATVSYQNDSHIVKAHYWRNYDRYYYYSDPYYYDPGYYRGPIACVFGLCI